MEPGNPFDQFDAFQSGNVFDKFDSTPSVPEQPEPIVQALKPLPDKLDNGPMGYTKAFFGGIGDALEPKSIAYGSYESSYKSALNDLANIQKEEIDDANGKIPDVNNGYVLDNKEFRAAARKSKMIQVMENIKDAKEGMSRNYIKDPNFGQEMLQGTEGFAKLVIPSALAAIATGGASVPVQSVAGMLAGGAAMGNQGYNNQLATSLQEQAQELERKGAGYKALTGQLSDYTQQTGNPAFDYSSGQKIDPANPEQMREIMSNQGFVDKRQNEANDVGAVDTGIGALFNLVPGLGSAVAKNILLKNGASKLASAVIPHAVETASVLGLGTGQQVANNAVTDKPLDENVGKSALSLGALHYLNKGAVGAGKTIYKSVEAYNKSRQPNVYDPAKDSNYGPSSQPAPEVVAPSIEVQPEKNVNTLTPEIRTAPEPVAQAKVETVAPEVQPALPTPSPEPTSAPEPKAPEPKPPEVQPSPAATTLDAKPSGFGSESTSNTPTVEAVMKNETIDDAMARKVKYQIDNGLAKLTHDGSDWVMSITNGDGTMVELKSFDKQKLMQQAFAKLYPNTALVPYSENAPVAQTTAVQTDQSTPVTQAPDSFATAATKTPAVPDVSSPEYQTYLQGLVDQHNARQASGVIPASKPVTGPDAIAQPIVPTSSTTAKPLQPESTLPASATQPTQVPSTQVKNSRKATPPVQIQQSQLPIQPASQTPEPAYTPVKQIDFGSGQFGAVVEHEITGHMKSGINKINTSADVAHVVGDWFAKRPQENLAVVAVDKDGNILSISRQTIGGITSTFALPGIIGGSALRFEGAARVWTVHNHPSKKPQLSSADVDMNRHLITLLKKSGINFAGSLAIAGDKYSFVDSKGKIIENVQIPDIPRTLSIPYTDRVYSKSESLGKPLDFTTYSGRDEIVQDLPKMLNGKTGIVFVDNNSMPVGTLEMSPEKMETLRQSGGLDKLLPHAERSNAMFMMIHIGNGLPLSTITNIGDNLTKVGNAIQIAPVALIGDGTDYRSSIGKTKSISFNSAAPLGAAGLAAASALSPIDIISIGSVLTTASSDRILSGLNPIIANLHLKGEDTGSKTVVDIANIFGNKGGNTPEGAKETYDSERDANLRIFRGKLANAFEPLGKLSEEQLKAKAQTLAAAMSGEVTLTGPDAEVVKRLRVMADEIHAYAREAGVTLGYTKDYGMPHSFDVGKVLADDQGFLRAAIQAYTVNNPARISKLSTRLAELDQVMQDKGKLTAAQMKEYEELNAEKNALSSADPAKQAEDLLNGISFGNEGGDMTNGIILESHSRGNNTANFLKGRTFEPEARQILRSYYNNDLRHVWNGYISRMTRLAEFSRRFGQDGAEWNKMKAQMIKDGLTNKDITDVKNMVLDSLGALTPRPTPGLALANSLLGLSNMSKLKTTAVTVFLESQSNAMAGGLTDAITAPLNMAGNFIAHVAELTPAQRETFKKYVGIDLNTETGSMELARICGVIDAVGIHNILENSAHNIAYADEVTGATKQEKAARSITGATTKLARTFGLEAAENAKRATATRYAADRLAQHTDEFLNDNMFARAWEKAKPGSVNPFTVKNEARMRLRRAGISDAVADEFCLWYQDAVKSGEFNERISNPDDPMARLALKAIRMEGQRATVTTGRTNKIGGQAGNPLISQDTFFGKAAMSFLNYPGTFKEQVFKPFARDVKKAYKGYDTENGHSTLFSGYERARMAARVGAIPAMAISAGVWLALRVYMSGDEEKIKEYEALHPLKKAMHAATYTGAAGGKAEFVSRAQRGQLFPVLDEGVRLSKNMNRPDDSKNRKERAVTNEAIRSGGVPALEAISSVYLPTPLAVFANQAVGSYRFREEATNLLAGEKQFDKRNKLIPLPPKPPKPPAPPAPGE